MATLFLVSTPIGNLGDLTPRAAETLGRVHRVLAEDTRRTRKLLNHLGLKTELVSLHGHNEASRVSTVLGWLDAGEDLALVSDAGTPLISDPGSRLVSAVAEAGYTIVPLPGPSAVLAALVASGFPGDRFGFLGFLPRKGKERGVLLGRIASAPEAVVVFESPERITKLLSALSEACGGTRRIAIGRELTKLHEEFVRGTVDEVRTHFESVRPRGEFVVVVEGAPQDKSESFDSDTAEERIRTLLEEGLAPSRVAKEVAQTLGVGRNQAYRMVQELSGESEGDG